jgi:hypothetical protein
MVQTFGKRGKSCPFTYPSISSGAIKLGKESLGKVYNLLPESISGSRTVHTKCRTGSVHIYWFWVTEHILTRISRL